jgi:hypothetical protein
MGGCDVGVLFDLLRKIAKFEANLKFYLAAEAS